MTLPLPYAKSITRRRKAANEARKALARYQALMDPRYDNDGDQADPHRIQALLWAKAWVDQALAVETRGRMGNLKATPRDYLTALTENGAQR